MKTYDHYSLNNLGDNFYSRLRMLCSRNEIHHVSQSSVHDFFRKKIVIPLEHSAHLNKADKVTYNSLSLPFASALVRLVSIHGYIVRLDYDTRKKDPKVTVQVTRYVGHERVNDLLMSDHILKRAEGLDAIWPSFPYTMSSFQSLIETFVKSSGKSLIVHNSGENEDLYLTTTLEERRYYHLLYKDGTLMREIYLRMSTQARIDNDIHLVSPLHHSFYREGDLVLIDQKVHICTEPNIGLKTPVGRRCWEPVEDE